MVVFPNCKINLGLSVLRKRPDNFHDLETIFYPLPFYEPLELIPAAKLSFEQSGTGLEIIDPHDNSCVRAWQLLKNEYPQLPDVKIHLHKCIPLGAGLGGGSADAAYTLMALNKLFQLALPSERLMQYALLLGSDSPFFLINKPCIATGRGEKLVEAALDLSGYSVVIVNPCIHVSTVAAFSTVVPRVPDTGLADTISRPVAEWKGKLVNDFETPVFKKHPEIAKLKADLYQAGALYSSMSGSGSTVFGIFEKADTRLPSFPAQYLVRRFEI